MANEDKTLTDKAKELAVNEAKSAAFWWTLGKIPVLVATVWGLWVAIPNLASEIPNHQRKAGYGELACMTNEGLLTSLDSRYMKKHCPNGIYQFRGFKND